MTNMLLMNSAKKFQICCKVKIRTLIRCSRIHLSLYFCVLIAMNTEFENKTSEFSENFMQTQVLESEVFS